MPDAEENGCSLLNRHENEEELIAEQETTPVRCRDVEGMARDGVPNVWGKRSELNRTVEESDLSDDDGTKPLDFRRHARRFKSEDDSVTRSGRSGGPSFVVKGILQGRKEEVSLKPVPKSTASYTAAAVTSGTDFAIKQRKADQEVETFVKLSKATRDEKKGLSPRGPSKRRRGRPPKKAAVVADADDDENDAVQTLEVPRRGRGSRGGRVPNASGRKRGRPRGSKSATYTVRSRPVLKPMFGDNTSASASEFPDPSTCCSDSESNLMCAGDYGKTQEGSNPATRVTVVRPLFSRHYIVRRPFAIKEADEKTIEFVMHETYFSRLNPYATKRINNESSLGDDLQFFQLNNVLMRGLSAVDPLIEPDDQLEVDKPNEDLVQDGSGKESSVGSVSTFFSKGEIQAVENELDETLETKTSMECDLGSERDVNNNEVGKHPLEDLLETGKADATDDNFMSNILLDDVEEDEKEKMIETVPPTLDFVVYQNDADVENNQDFVTSVGGVKRKSAECNDAEVPRKK